METKEEKKMLELKYQYLVKATLATSAPGIAHFLALETKQLLDMSQVKDRSKMERFHCSKCHHWLYSHSHGCCVRLYRGKGQKHKKRMWLITTCGRCEARRKDTITSKNNQSCLAKDYSVCSSRPDKPTGFLEESFLFETQ